MSEIIKNTLFILHISYSDSNNCFYFKIKVYRALTFECMRKFLAQIKPVVKHWGTRDFSCRTNNKSLFVRMNNASQDDSDNFQRTAWELVQIFGKYWNIFTEYFRPLETQYIDRAHFALLHWGLQASDFFNLYNLIDVFYSIKHSS